MHMSGYRAGLRSEATQTANEEANSTHSTTNNKRGWHSRATAPEKRKCRKTITVFGSFFIGLFNPNPTQLP